MGLDFSFPFKTITAASSTEEKFRLAEKV